MTSRVVDSSRTESPRWLLYGILALIACVLPQVASAQSIAGVVRDTSGAILPGVTVEAASPALIEKVRTTVSDGTGTVPAGEPRPGVYTVTYTLPGFTTVKRDRCRVADRRDGDAQLGDACRRIAGDPDGDW